MFIIYTYEVLKVWGLMTLVQNSIKSNYVELHVEIFIVGA